MSLVPMGLTEENSSSLLNNKYKNLSNAGTLNRNASMNQYPIFDNNNNKSGNSKTSNPFYVKIDENWTILAQKITEMNSKNL